MRFTKGRKIRWMYQAEQEKDSQFCRKTEGIAKKTGQGDRRPECRE